MIKPGTICQVIDCQGSVTTRATVKKIIYARDGGQNWVRLVNEHGQEFHATPERILDLGGIPFAPPMNRMAPLPEPTQEDDELFVLTIMEFLASDAKTIDEFNRMDPVHMERRRNKRRKR